jgi:hypothetical protein
VLAFPTGKGEVDSVPETIAPALRFRRAEFHHEHERDDRRAMSAAGKEKVSAAPMPPV